MGNNVLDLHRSFIENQKRQIELANKLIKGCEKCISTEQNIMNNYEK